MSKYLTEFIGTFFLVLTIGLTAVSGSTMAPLAIGSTLMVMVYMGGHVSGAHYNPAVSLAVFIRGKLGLADLLIYIFMQVLGALAASATAYFVTRNTFAPRPGNEVTETAALVVEALYTFALALVVLNAATAKKTEGNSFYGLAIGFTITAAAFAGGPISGGAFNPAVGTGPSLFQFLSKEGQTLSFLWLYLVGPFTGGALAGIVFKIQNPDD